MKILHVHDQPELRGGAEVYIRQVNTLLHNAGFVSEVCVATFTGRLWQILFSDSLRNFQNTSDASAFIASIACNFDLVCLHNLFENEIVDDILNVAPVIKFSHSPVIVCPGRDKYWRLSESACNKPYGAHCLWHAYSQGCANRHPKRLMKAYSFVSSEIKRAKSGYQRIMVMSQFNKERLLECDIPARNIVVNPYFTDYVELPEKVNTVSTNLLFIGRLIAGKGLYELLNATKPILKENSKLALHIVGDGPLLHGLKNYIQENGLEYQVYFHGWQSREQITAHLRSCRMLVFPSTYPESFGIAGIESLMHGKPVAGFDVGGVSTWLKHNENGFLVPVGDVKALENAISQLMYDDSLYGEFSKNAREMAIRDFLPVKHLEILTTTFNEIKDTIRRKPSKSTA